MTGLTTRQIQEFVNWYKRTCPCKDCGWTGPAACMDFDHVPERGQKISTIRKFVDDHDISGLWNEIAKCDVVCARCHRIRTVNRGASPESIEKSRRAQTGRKRNPPRFRHPATPETRKKISEARKAQVGASRPDISIRMKALWADPDYRERMKSRRPRGSGRKNVIV